ncbi:MAG: acetyl-CoA carboxylase biotin carboxylase subunit [Terriglobia bacterium]
MFRKVLIANRGEIAVRIIRAARDLGMATVAVYSECDRGALHVRMADEAYLLGPAPSRESYLAMDKVIGIAVASGVEAIHPGYGFLAENAEFARRCDQADIGFVGPHPSSIEMMGEKIAARKSAVAVGVPVVPGTENPVRELEDAKEAAEKIGFPLLIKASAGGGGKGMRLVETGETLAASLRDAQAEAMAAFGDSSVYLERYVVSPRHIEFQILADRYGHTIHLGERECSIQRRHQKLIEECPSPCMTSELRQQMGEAAVRIAQSCGYQNAGTVEFLVDAQGNFYFLEVNTRLQVEHPVTELVTGIDLVKEQFKIACGERLERCQEDIEWRGAALECRICAEDPENNFFPSPGTITSLRTPSGPGIRDDSGIYEGWTIPLYYDPLLSKLISFGSDRREAIARMRRALLEYQVTGIKTNLSFFNTVLNHERFVAGELSTDFIERYYRPEPGHASPPHRLEEIAAIAAALHEERKNNGGRFSAGQLESPWKLSGRLESMRNRS